MLLGHLQERPSVDVQGAGQRVKFPGSKKRICKQGGQKISRDILLIRSSGGKKEGMGTPAHDGRKITELLPQWSVAAAKERLLCLGIEGGRRFKIIIDHQIHRIIKGEQIIHINQTSRLAQRFQISGSNEIGVNKQYGPAYAVRGRRHLPGLLFPGRICGKKGQKSGKFRLRPAVIRMKEMDRIGIPGGEKGRKKPCADLVRYEKMGFNMQFCQSIRYGKAASEMAGGNLRIPVRAYQNGLCGVHIFQLSRWQRHRDRRPEKAQPPLFSWFETAQSD